MDVSPALVRRNGTDIATTHLSHDSAQSANAPCSKAICLMAAERRRELPNDDIE
jgi:hypothetical protein